MPARPLMLTLALTATCLLAVAVGGCFSQSETASNVDVGAARQAFVLPEEPEGLMTTLELIDPENGFTSGKVTLVGKVGGMPNPMREKEANFPWREGQALFFLVDPATAQEFADEMEGHKHEDGVDCVFCLKKAKDKASSVAGVSFNGPDGKPLPIGAKELFDLEEGDTVVVQGDAIQLEGLLVVNAKGLYVRK